MSALAASFALSLAAWLALALAMERHQRDLTGRKWAVRPSRALRLVGWLLLAASAAPLIARWGVLTGVSIWGALLSVAAVAVVLAMTLFMGRRKTEKK
jgi:hypothetical protein